MYLPLSPRFLLRFVSTANRLLLSPLEWLLVSNLLQLVLPMLSLDPALDALLQVIHRDPGPECDLDIFTVRLAHLDPVDLAALEHGAQDLPAYPLILGAVLDAAAAGQLLPSAVVVIGRLVVHEWQ